MISTISPLQLSVPFRIALYKCFESRRRWRCLLWETLFATILFMIAVLIAKPVFLTPLETEPEAPLTTADLLASLSADSIVGFSPDTEPYISIMERAATSLSISLMSGETENELNNHLYHSAKLDKRKDISVLWVIWKPKDENMWQFSIRSTERARHETSTESTADPNPHLRAGFLAVQVAITRAIIAESTPDAAYEVNLKSMPVSPLMQQDQVRKALSGILLCFTIALIPPVLEAQGLAVSETTSRFKKSLRMRGVSYIPMYLGWLVYAFLTALPICFVASVALLLIFRWIHLVVGIMLLLAYMSAMILTALIMAMFHSKTWIACVWSILFTLLQTYMAELLVHHEYDQINGAVTFLLHLLMPPLGLVHAMNNFALLSTGELQEDTFSLWYSLGSWGVLIVLYFVILMFLQRTIGQDRAIGGQVSWKSIIFKKVEDRTALHEIENPTGTERDKLQAVDELLAKAVSFRNVSKTIMGVPILQNVTMDIYRGEFTMLFAERVQEKMITTAGDLLTGLTFADHGSITVLGQVLRPGETIMTELHMAGFCHHASFLVPDLTVLENFELYRDICLWKETQSYVYQYGHMRWRRLVKECDLERVQHAAVRRLDAYYRAQLCWAVAMLLEPRVLIIPNFSDQDPRYIMVIRDKIMQYKKYITVILLSFSSLELEYADRVFIFESKVLAFGGTPAYMFFKYGREYRVRMTIRSDGSVESPRMRALVARAAAAGGSVRAHLGSLLILRLPAAPTSTVADLVKDLTQNSSYYGMLSIHIGVPDSEEVYRRAMMETKAQTFKAEHASAEIAEDALRKMSVPPVWKDQKLRFSNLVQLKQIGWKYLAFHVRYRVFFIITFVSAMLVGIFIGYSLSTMLTKGEREEVTDKLLRGEILTIEFVNIPTTLVLRADYKPQSISLANAYVLSEPGAQKDQVDRISYNGLAGHESLTEYLVTRAIDSPKLYVTMFAYGLDVKTNDDGILVVQALYSPLHKDYGAAARSLAKAYTAILRHFTGNLDASIQVTDYPLELDLIPWTKVTNRPPLFVQFLLILVISHMTLIPSMEYGFIRHVQSHAKKFSPLRYWLTLYAWDLVLYWLLVCIMTGFMMLMMYLIAPSGYFQYEDLLVLPFMLILYGFACVPQAYLFSLGPRVALNSMTFVIVNVVFGETTIIAQTFYGEFLTYALLLMRLSPQFNMAYAFVKIKQIFLYNSECFIFKKQNLCLGKTLHKCCAKCGILQACFKKKNYLSSKTGILTESVSMISLAALYTVILLILEYKVWQRIRMWWNRTQIEPQVATHLQPGVQRVKEDVLEKWAHIKQKRRERFDTFGERLLANNLTRKELGVYSTHSVYLGVGQGEALAVAGLKRHGRRQFVELLAGYTLPDAGHAVCMSKWDLSKHPHNYSRHVSLSCALAPLPAWMTVLDALTLLAVLRGVPKKHISQDLDNIIDALEIQHQTNTLICDIVSKADQSRLHFAAAIVGEPPIIIVDECTAHQKNSVRRAMYCILHYLRKRGHAIISSASSVETHMPMTNRLAILLDGAIFDIDTVDSLVGRYSNQGYTVVLHLKDEVNIKAIFARHFREFVINDTSEVLVNVQILDDLNWAAVFERMEILKKINDQVYSYIVTAIPIDYIYNSIITNEKGNQVTSDFVSGFRFRKSKVFKIQPSKERLDALIPFQQKYDITRLRELPWSVIFQT